jgi:hypothetical protein
MNDQTKTPADVALEILAQAYAYYDAPQASQTKQAEPQEYYEYFAAA